MKKTMSVILAAVMVLTMAAFTTACGDKESASGMQTSSQAAEGTSGTDAGSASGSVFPAALKDVPAIEVPSIAITGWELTGGMIDGVEMEQSDLDATLQACGGKLQFIFPDREQKAQLINGEKVLRNLRDHERQLCVPR